MVRPLVAEEKKEGEEPVEDPVEVEGAATGQFSGDSSDLVEEAAGDAPPKDLLVEVEVRHMNIMSECTSDDEDCLNVDSDDGGAKECLSETADGPWALQRACSFGHEEAPEDIAEGGEGVLNSTRLQSTFDLSLIHI